VFEQESGPDGELTALTVRRRAGGP